MLRARLVLLGLVLFCASAVWAAPLLGTKGAGDDADRWLLDDAEIVLSVNLKQLVGSDLMKKGGAAGVKDLIKGNEQVKVVLEAAGIDPLKDVDSILLSGSGGSKTDVKALVVIKGRFDPEKAFGAARKRDDVEVVKDGATEILKLKIQDTTAYAAFAGKSTLVMTQSKESTADWVKNGGKKAAKVSKEMQAAQGNFKGNESLTFAMVINDDLKKLIAKIPQLAVAGPKLQTLTASVTLTDEVDLKVVGNTSDAKAANQLKGAVTVLKGVAEVMASGDENLGPLVTDILNEVKVTSDRESVNVALKVGKAMIEKAGKGGK